MRVDSIASRALFVERISVSGSEEAGFAVHLASGALFCSIHSEQLFGREPKIFSSTGAAAPAELPRGAEVE